MLDHQDIGISGLIDELEKRIVTTLLTQSINDKMGFVRLSAVTFYSRWVDEYRTIYVISWRFGQKNSDEEISGEFEVDLNTSNAVVLYQRTIRKIIEQVTIKSIDINDFLDNEVAEDRF